MTFFTTLCAVVLGNWLYDAYFKYEDKDGNEDQNLSQDISLQVLGFIQHLYFIIGYWTKCQ